MSNCKDLKTRWTMALFQSIGTTQFLQIILKYYQLNFKYLIVLCLVYGQVLKIFY